MRWTEVSCSSQLYSVRQITYTLRVERSHMSDVHSHEGKLHVKRKPQVADKPPEAKTYFSTEADKQITITSCDE